MVLTCFRGLFILATEGVCGEKEWFARRGCAPEDQQAGRKGIGKGGEKGKITKQSQQVIYLQHIPIYIRFLFAMQGTLWDTPKSESPRMRI